jgi:hypothetical protein
MMQNGGMRPALLPMVSMDAATKGGGRSLEDARTAR